MTNVVISMPNQAVPVLGPNGVMNEIWWRFFLTLIQRTGGAGGIAAGDIQALVEAIQASDFLLLAPNSSTLPNSSVLAVGAGLEAASSSGTFTISLSIPVAVRDGGTSLESLPAHGVLVGNGTAAPNFAEPAAAGTVLQSGGAGLDPTFQPTVNSIAGGTGIVASSATGDVTVSLSTPVSIADGGTALSAMPSHEVLIGNGAAAPNFAAPGTVGQVLTSNGVSADPTFQSIPASVSSIIGGTGITVSSPSGNVTVSLSVPVSVADGGTGATAAGGTALDNISGFTGTGLLERTGAGTYSLIAPATFLQSANNLGDVANPSTARGNLGLGTMSVQNATAVAITGGSADGLTLGASATRPASVTTLVVNDPSTGSTSSVLLESTANAAGVNIKMTGNGATTPSKFMRVYNGLWQLLSNAGGLLMQSDDSGNVQVAGTLTTGSTVLLSTTATLNNGASTALGTLANAPAAGNPTKWVEINDNGTIRYIPAW